MASPQLKKIYLRGIKEVFTIGTSVASIATAWVRKDVNACTICMTQKWINGKLLATNGFSSMMNNNYKIRLAAFKKLINPGSSNVAAYIATAGTAFVIGYGFGWQGGRWYANRRHRKEQMKLLGQTEPKRWLLLGPIKPREWQFEFLRRQLVRSKAPRNVAKSLGKILHSGKLRYSC